jgi:hypothetical protein
MPHISATPRDRADTRRHDSSKTNDIRYEIDTRQPFDSSFSSSGAGIETQAAHQQYQELWKALVNSCRSNPSFCPSAVLKITTGTEIKIRPCDGRVKSLWIDQERFTYIAR